MLIRFPQEETGKKCKLSKPWHGPYRVIQKNDPDMTAIPVHFPDCGPIQVHQSRVCPCPPKWSTGFYWYGGNRLSRGGVPKWLDKLLSQQPTDLDKEDGPPEVAEDPPEPREDVIQSELTEDSSQDDGEDENLVSSTPYRESVSDGRYSLG